MINTGIKLDANNRKNNNNEKNQQQNIKQGRHRLQDRRQNNLQTGHTGHQLQRSEHSERAQNLQIKADALAGHKGGQQTRRDNDEVHDAPHTVQIGALMEQ